MHSDREDIDTLSLELTGDISEKIKKKAKEEERPPEEVFSDILSTLIEESSPKTKRKLKPSSELTLKDYPELLTTELLFDPIVRANSGTSYAELSTLLNPPPYIFILERNHYADVYYDLGYAPHRNEKHRKAFVNTIIQKMEQSFHKETHTKSWEEVEARPGEGSGVAKELLVSDAEDLAETIARYTATNDMDESQLSKIGLSPIKDQPATSKLNKARQCLQSISNEEDFSRGELYACFAAAGITDMKEAEETLRAYGELIKPTPSTYSYINE